MSVWIDLNSKDFENDIKSIAAFKEASTTFGLHDIDSSNIKEVPAGYDGDNKTLREVATEHEFGAGRNPQRSFVRSTFDRRVNQYMKSLKFALSHFLHFRTKNFMRDEMQRIGDSAAQDIVLTIDRSIPPPLKKSSLKRKRQFPGISVEKPLIWTGELRRKIKAKVKIT